MPEADSGFELKPEATGQTRIIATAHGLATRAGYDILAEGGDAVDAAIAAQMVLGVVEPQSSGIGGGGFMLYFDGERTTVLDGRETAPARATDELLLSDGVPLGYAAAASGGRAVGTPGLLAMLEEAHRRYGKLPWARLFEPARRLCLDGFPVSARLAKLLSGREAKALSDDPDARAYFFDPNGEPRRAGFIIQNPALAGVLAEVAAHGAGAFYHGRIARAVVAAVRDHATNPGLLTQRDLAFYRAKERSPLCFAYRQYRVCGVPPPSSGALAIGQALGMLEGKHLSDYPPVKRSFGLEPAPEAVHLISEALRLAFADRDRYVADADFVRFPGGSYQALLAPDYIEMRARSISADRSMGRANAGNPGGEGALTFADDQSPEFPSTTHLSIVDGFGHAVAMTNTIERGFGSGIMVLGFLLNNELTDFDSMPRRSGELVANRVEPGKRPRSSMSPTFVFHMPTGRLMEVTGSPGGSAIISYVLKSLVAVLDWNLTPNEVVALPNFGSRNQGPTELEAGRTSLELVEWLQARGHETVVIPQTSGVELIVRDPTQLGAPQLDGLLRGAPQLEGSRLEVAWRAAIDPRREGLALGDSAL